MSCGVDRHDGTWGHINLYRLEYTEAAENYRKRELQEGWQLKRRKSHRKIKEVERFCLI